MFNHCGDFTCSCKEDAQEGRESFSELSRRRARLDAFEIVM